jgi:hypothetical protein
MQTCIICSISFELTSQTFEQRLIDDNDFCPHCFKEIMDAEYDNDFELDLRAAAQKIV